MSAPLDESLEQDSFGTALAHDHSIDGDDGQQQQQQQQQQQTAAQAETTTTPSDDAGSADAPHLTTEETSPAAGGAQPDEENENDNNRQQQQEDHEPASLPVFDVSEIPTASSAGSVDTASLLSEEDHHQLYHRDIVEAMAVTTSPTSGVGDDDSMFRSAHDKSSVANTNADGDSLVNDSASESYYTAGAGTATSVYTAGAPSDEDSSLVAAIAAGVSSGGGGIVDLSQQIHNLEERLTPLVSASGRMADEALHLQQQLSFDQQRELERKNEPETPKHSNRGLLLGSTTTTLSRSPMRQHVVAELAVPTNLFEEGDDDNRPSSSLVVNDDEHELSEIESDEDGHDEVSALSDSKELDVEPSELLSERELPSDKIPEALISDNDIKGKVTKGSNEGDYNLSLSEGGIFNLMEDNLSVGGLADGKSGGAAAVAHTEQDGDAALAGTEEGHLSLSEGGIFEIMDEEFFPTDTASTLAIAEHGSNEPLSGDKAAATEDIDVALAEAESDFLALLATNAMDDSTDLIGASVLGDASDDASQTKQQNDLPNIDESDSPVETKKSPADVPPPEEAQTSEGVDDAVMSSQERLSVGNPSSLDTSEISEDALVRLKLDVSERSLASESEMSVRALLDKELQELGLASETSIPPVIDTPKNQSFTSVASAENIIPEDDEAAPSPQLLAPTAGAVLETPTASAPSSESSGDAQVEVIEAPENTAELLRQSQDLLEKFSSDDEARTEGGLAVIHETTLTGAGATGISAESSVPEMTTGSASGVPLAPVRAVGNDVGEAPPNLSVGSAGDARAEDAAASMISIEVEGEKSVEKDSPSTPSSAEAVDGRTLQEETATSTGSIGGETGQLDVKEDLSSTVVGTPPNAISAEATTVPDVEGEVVCQGVPPSTQYGKDIADDARVEIPASARTTGEVEDEIRVEESTPASSKEMLKEEPARETPAAPTGIYEVKVDGDGNESSPLITGETMPMEKLASMTAATEEAEGEEMVKESDAKEAAPRAKTEKETRGIEVKESSSPITDEASLAESSKLSTAEVVDKIQVEDGSLPMAVVEEVADLAPTKETSDKSSGVVKSDFEPAIVETSVAGVEGETLVKDSSQSSPPEETVENKQAMDSTETDVAKSDIEVKTSPPSGAKEDALSVEASATLTKESPVETETQVEASTPSADSPVGEIPAEESADSARTGGVKDEMENKASPSLVVKEIAEAPTKFAEAEGEIQVKDGSLSESSEAEIEATEPAGSARTDGAKDGLEITAGPVSVVKEAASKEITEATTEPATVDDDARVKESPLSPAGEMAEVTRAKESADLTKADGVKTETDAGSPSVVEEAPLTETIEAPTKPAAVEDETLVEESSLCFAEELVVEPKAEEGTDSNETNEAKSEVDAGSPSVVQEVLSTETTEAPMKPAAVEDETRVEESSPSLPTEEMVVEPKANEATNLAETADITSDSEIKATAHPVVEEALPKESMRVPTKSAGVEGETQLQDSSPSSVEGVVVETQVEEVPDSTTEVDALPNETTEVLKPVAGEDETHVEESSPYPSTEETLAAETLDPTLTDEANIETGGLKETSSSVTMETSPRDTSGEPMTPDRVEGDVKKVGDPLIDAPAVAWKDDGVVDPSGGSAPTERHEQKAPVSRPKVTKPPLFPKKSARDLYENPDRFVEFLSSKLVNTKLKRPFDTGTSVFSNVDGVSEVSDLSPPGSPPEPVFDSFHDDSSSDSSQDSPYRSLPVFVHPEIAVWDMLAEPTTKFPVSDESFRHPDFVMMPGDPTTPTDSVANWETVSDSDPTQVSDLGASARPLHASSAHGRRPNTFQMTRKRAIGRRTRVKRSRFWRRKCTIPSLKLTKSEDLTAYYSPDGDETETVSLGAQTLESSRQHQETLFRVPTTSRDARTHLLQKSFSSPDLGPRVGERLDDLETPKKDLFRSLQRSASTDERVRVRGVKLSYQSEEDRHRDIASLAALPHIPLQKPNHTPLLGSAERDGSTTTATDDLEEELMAFSSVQPIDFPFKHESSDSVRYFGCLRWQQLASCWRHEEVSKSLMKDQTWNAGTAGTADDDIELSVFSSPDRVVNECIDVLVLNGTHFSNHSEAKHIGSSQRFSEEPGLLSLSRFLSQSTVGAGEDPLEQILPPDYEVSATELRKAAEANMKMLTSILETIVGFSYSNATEDEVSTIDYNVCLKPLTSIENKAARKYGGNVMEVKDVLRGSIVFPNLGYLLCGLVRLNQITDTKAGWEYEGKRTKLQLLSVKNLFASQSPAGGLDPSPLLTGYRHVLVRIRLDGGIIAEIQYHLSALFHVLGEDGYILHQELTDLDRALKGNLQVNELVERAIRNVQLPPKMPKVSETEAKDSAVTPTKETRPGSSPSPKRSPTDQDDISPPKFDRHLSELATPKRTGSSVLSPDNFRSTSSSKPLPWSLLTPPPGWRPSTETRRRLLDDLESKGDDLSTETAILAILECGASVASTNPRDVATYFCLYSLFSYFLSEESAALVRSIGPGVHDAMDFVEFSRRCLLRCFTLCTQARSLGMAGWLEYGESDPVVRLGDGPANLLTLIAGSYAQESKWNEAQAVLETLLLKYEKVLPSHHPLIIASLLKLAAVVGINGNTSFMTTLVTKATETVSRYLVELETSLMSYVNRCSQEEPSGQPSPAFRVESGPGALAALTRFVSAFQGLIGAQSPLHFHGVHAIANMEHCLLADAMAVLANCMACVRVCLGSASPEVAASSEQYYWKLALAHYHKAFKGFSERKGFDDARVCGSAFGMARCLRELGEPEKALELLSTIVGALEATSSDPQNAVRPAPQRTKRPPRPMRAGGGKEKVSFLSCALLSSQADAETPNSKSANEPQVHQHVTVALCLWFMSVLSVDTSPDERGRTRAFGLLHAASVSLQIALAALPEGEGSHHTTCLDILERIENEAKKISRQSTLE